MLLLRRLVLIALDLKDAYAIGLGIDHVKAIACVNPQGGGMAEVRTFDFAGEFAEIESVEHLASMTVDLNLVEVWITDVDVAPVVDSQSAVRICIAKTDGAQKMAGSIENLNARISGIQHEQFTSGCDYLAGEAELAGAVTTAAVPQLTNQFPSRVHDENHVTEAVAYVNVSRTLIDGDGCGAIEVGFPSSQFS